MQTSSINKHLQPLSWLIGKWRSIETEGTYPTIKPFSYCEEIEFTSVGQPILNYTSKSWHPIGKQPMHLETGFLRIKPDSDQLAFMVAHNFGLTSLEEGTVKDNIITLKSITISRMSFAKEPAVTEITRSFQFNSDDQTLQILTCMATCSTPLTVHLKAIYKKSDDC